MTTVSNNQLGILEFSLAWNSGDASHLDRHHANKVNFWRDIFPRDLRQELEGLAPGQSASVRHRLAAPKEALRYTLPETAFSGLSFQGRKLTPRLGRFYPRGRIKGLPKVYDQCDLRPGRITAITEAGDYTLDVNHPLAGHEVSITATVLSLTPKLGDTGGTMYHWQDEATGNGPGMQAALPSQDLGTVLATDFACADDFARQDESPDTQFYAEPRLVEHLDVEALSALAEMYGRRVKSGTRVLDLMASANSHLPEGFAGHVTGLGLNAEELAANPVLKDRIMHDLNAAPSLPFADASFDTVLLSLSVEYLTKPQQVLREAARVLAPGGKLLVSFSDRFFPTKAVRLWPELHDYERLGYVLGLMRETNAFTGLGTETLRCRPRPAEDAHAQTIRWSDPVYLAEAVRKA
jgi:SAM-dependent methyltransferase